MKEENFEKKFEELKKSIAEQKQIARELDILHRDFERNSDEFERKMIGSQIDSLTNSLKEITKQTTKLTQNISMVKPLEKTKIEKKKVKKERLKFIPGKERKKLLKNLSEIELLTLKRLKRKKKKSEKKKVKKANSYIKFSNKVFSKYASSLFNKKYLRTLENDLNKANIVMTPESYVSVVLFTSFISFLIMFFIALFLLFFNISFMSPFISTVSEPLSVRFLKIFWIVFVIPFGTFLIAFFYPSMEKKSLANKIDQEIPFATIHMSAISGSLIEPSKIFSIIISTKEYKNIEKEFTKIMNEVNIYGYNLVNALKRTANNTASKKLAELLNGLSTTITSGGDLPEFFNKRAETLLFEYKLEREKKAKNAETFMDIYISVVIAAPMILMLLLMTIKITGLGLSLSMGALGTIIVLIVSIVNVIFLAFLHLKNPV